VKIGDVGKVEGRASDKSKLLCELATHKEVEDYPELIECMKASDQIYCLEKATDHNIGEA
jgi:hypothetical protein